MIKKLTMATQEEMEQIIDLWLEANIQAHDFIDPGYWHSNLDLMRELLPKADLIVYLNHDKQIKGFIGLTGEYIAGIFVAKQYQSQGIGKELLDYAKDRNERLTLSVYEKNKKAIAFYQRQDFIIKSLGFDEENAESEYEMVWQ